MAHDPAFDSAQNQALLVVCARKTIRNAAIAGIVWGGLNLFIGYFAVLTNPLNAGILALALLMLGTGLAALRKPSLGAPRATCPARSATASRIYPSATALDLLAPTSRQLPPQVIDLRRRRANRARELNVGGAGRQSGLNEQYVQLVRVLCMQTKRRPRGPSLINERKIDRIAWFR